MNAKKITSTVDTKLTLRINDKPVKPGEKIKNFRGETRTFVKATRATESGRTGEVVVDEGDGRHWTYYATVFEGIVTVDWVDDDGQERKNCP